MNSFSDLLVSPREAALSALANYQARPVTTVSYISTGTLLLIGADHFIKTAIKHLPESLKPFVLLTTECCEDLSQELEQAAIPMIQTTAKIDVHGYLGEFQVATQIENRAVSVHAVFSALTSASGFDLVVDLQSPPSIKRDVLPIGYFAPGESVQQYEQILNECTGLVGEFDKPKFFNYDPSICAHSRSGVTGCSRCLEACPAEAIISENQQITVHPFLCQGCGDCSTVCPAGAINYQYPDRTDTLNRIRLLIKAFFDSGGSAPVLLLHSDSEADWLEQQVDIVAGDVLPYSVESLGSIGIEIWLAALAYGATEIWLLDGDQITGSTRRLLDSQIVYTQEILSGMGFDPACVRWVSEKQLCSGKTGTVQSHDSPSAGFAGIQEKRSVIRLAVDHLLKHAPLKKHSIPLSEGAPFGELLIDCDACTLCMACVSTCPEGALSDGYDTPQLKLIEANCVQCGLCQRACPEQAITLSPRFLFDTGPAKKPRLLHEEAVFHCIECGKAFASQSMIQTITEKLKNHPMFQGEHNRRLKMCDDCRVNSMFNH